MKPGSNAQASSSKPSQPSRRNRRRHLPTVARVVPSWSATSMSLLPWAVSSTIRARKASAWEVLGRLTQFLPFVHPTAPEPAACGGLPSPDPPFYRPTIALPSSTGQALTIHYTRHADLGTCGAANAPHACQNRYRPASDARRDVGASSPSWSRRSRHLSVRTLCQG